MKERTLERQVVFEGRILRLELQKVELEDGRRSSREIVRHANAIVAICRLPDGKFVFVRQYRKPLEQDLLEAIAGGMEAGERPEESATREIGEESGFSVSRLVPLGSIVSTPGFCDEILHCFYAELCPRQGEQHPDDDESLDVVSLEKGEVEQKIASGEIWDAKTIACWAKAMAHL